MKALVMTAAIVSFSGTALAGNIVGYEDFGDGGSFNSISNNLSNSAIWGAGDAFFPVRRDALSINGIDAPFALRDDTVEDGGFPAGGDPFPTDTLGILGVADTTWAFGVTDTVNGDTSGPVSWEWTFDITGVSDLSVAIDFAAMGDFEASSDFFNFSYSIDGQDPLPLFTSSVDEDISVEYEMDNGNLVELPDPLFMNGVMLSNDFQTLSEAIGDTGDTLTILFETSTDGSEAFGFDNLTVSGNAIPAPGAIALLGLAGLAGGRRRRG